ncbi:MAG: glyceraldehyde-3-phosphate dehydrogenase [Crocinitomicaceae bacterium]|nr:glyceraldehyde-3-phosphate dehydrogenase [Crocinitomicaceae bacterium]
MSQIVLSNDTYSNELKVYINQEKAAVDLLSSVGRLLFDKSIELVLFRNHLVDTSISEVLRLHKYAAEVVGKPISIFDSSDLAKELYNMSLAPAKIDIGKLASEWLTLRDHFKTHREFLEDRLTNFTLEAGNEIEPRDVVLFGFGRIGRLAARELIRQAGAGQQLRLRAIVTREDDELSLKKRSALFENDSVHGSFKGTVAVDYENKCLLINGQRIYMIGTKDPASVDYTAYGINNALLIDNTGIFKDRTALSTHLKAKGISKVILTAPGKEVPNIVYGLNHRDLDIENETIFSAASCTTNAISPILKVIHDDFGIVTGHIETVHAYTNDQNLLDNMHKKSRRGRSAAINMVITETGAAKAVTKVIPELANKLTANAVRVPTPNGSLAIIHIYVGRETDRDEVNASVRKAALEGELVNQIYYSISEELVSSDVIGNDCCSVFDSEATIVNNEGKGLVLYVWYDNEFGYTKQVIRLAKHVARVRRNIYY